MFQRTPPWVMPHSARPITPIERRALPALPGRPARACAARIYAARELMVLGFVKQPRAMKLLETVGAQAPRALAARPGADREDDARLHRRLQAHPAVQRLVSGAARATTSSWSPTASPRCARARSCRRRARARGRRAGLRHRLPRDRHAGRAAGARARRAHAGRGLGRLARTPTSAARCRASRTCSSCSARTPASGTARWST